MLFITYYEFLSSSGSKNEVTYPPLTLERFSHCDVRQTTFSDKISYFFHQDNSDKMGSDSVSEMKEKTLLNNPVFIILYIQPTAIARTTDFPSLYSGLRCK